MNDKIKEEFIDILLIGLEAHAFIKSTDSITGETELFNPIVEDQEAVIKIDGEWDREDLKGILSTIWNVALEEAKKAVPEEFKRQWIGDRWGTEYGQHETLYGQTQEEVDWFNSCREQTLSNIDKLKI